MRHSGRFICMLLLAALAPLALAAKPSRHSVSIKDMRYDPATLDIKVGDTVEWENQDDRDHTVVARDGSFDSDNLRSGASYSFQFTKAGKFPYSCKYHPRMRGTISVTAHSP